MHRIDGPGNVNGLWSAGDPANAQRPTLVTADWMNDVQENVMALLAAGGVAPVKGDYGQIVAALLALLVKKAGDTMTGLLEVSTPGDTRIQVTAPVGNFAYVRLARPNGGRWDVGMTNDAETGTQGGSDFYVNAFSSAGGLIGRPLSISRTTLSVYINGNLAWHAGNDGAGSGLDADTLDGQEGGWYADIPGRLGYTPVNRAGDTMSGLLEVSTAGDTRTQVTAPAGHYAYTRFARAGAGRWDVGMTSDAETGNQGGSNFYVSCFGNDGTLLGRPLSVDRTTLSVYINGNLSWHAGNDGAGSGLDADTLDGLDSPQFMRATTNRWNASSEGFGRFYFTNAGPTVAQIVTTFSFQNSGATTVGSLDENGNFTVLTALKVGTHTAMHQGNDGAGSGYDADLLDGLEGAAYAKVAGQIFTGDIGPEAGFRMTFSGGNPGLLMSADGNTSVFFNRSTKVWTFYTDGHGVCDIDASGNMRLRGTLQQSVPLS